MTLPAIVLLLFSPFVAAQSLDPAAERAAVLATVQKFFDTMNSRDVIAAGKVLLPEGRFFSVREENGEPVVRSFTNAEFLARLAAGAGKLLERMWEPEVRIHGRIATVWTRYDFHRDGAFSHCGVDAFDLVKTPEGWKIAGGVYTVEQTGCPPSPLGAPR